MELNEADLKELRKLSEHRCEQEHSEHHEWLHDRLSNLMKDFDAMSAIARAAVPYAPVSAFEDQALVLQLKRGSGSR